MGRKFRLAQSRKELQKTMLCALCFMLMLCCTTQVWAQRRSDHLGRGLVAVKTSGGVFLSWRILGEEYYDVTYNVYRNGAKLNNIPLKVSNFTDTGGSAANTYTVSAVVRGTEQAQCRAVSVWNPYKYKLYTTCETGYFDIPLAKVYDNTGKDITNTYIANDAEVADLDGDGEMEIILKRRSTMDDAANYVSRSDGAYDRIDAYKMDGTLLWWIDVGPNMVSGGSHELNIIAYDWDGDGKAEVLLRGADDMMIHGQRGGSRSAYPQRIGRKGVNTRNTITHTANMTYTNTGDEYLIYMDGDHGIIYDAVRYMSYPLTRGAASDWGDSYGHRSSKYFMGAPYFDGKNPSIFLARGIYTRHKMVAYDVNPSTHSLTQRWYWENNSGWNNPWYGNGNHNYCIADVDLDGRDEIVYGSMVIDDNGKGLSTTGLGHGDALHCSDFDPFRPGLEIFACNEDEPASNYRNATTSKIYHRVTSSSDDGRALCDNFSNDYPGAMGRTTQTGMVSCVADKVISEIGDYIAWGDLNFRIYWDGDLLSEVLNSPGTEREAAILKPGRGRLFTSSGCKMNNWTKNHPCFSGDILGDWREEIIVRVGEGHDAIRIYTSAMPTEHAIYTLWHDHQYRQAMVWQMHAYNQPPHLSYFLGEMEGITVAPPPLTTTNRTWIGHGATIGSNYNGQHLLHNEYANTSLNVADGAAPYILTVNVPTWVQGTNSTSTTNPYIIRTTYSCNLNGGSLTGSMRLIKQGDGVLNMASVTHTYTGETNIWGGTVNFNGTLQSSPVWMNRHTTLNSDGGQFLGGLTMEYGSTLNVGGATQGRLSSVTTGALTLNYGARVVLDVNGSEASEHDWLNAASLTVDDSKASAANWVNYGPAHIVPVVELRLGNVLGDGLYPLGHIASVNGDLSKVKLECSRNTGKVALVHQDGTLYLQVTGSPSSSKANIDIADMVPAGNSYLPLVNISKNTANGQTPTLSGFFTNLNGETYSIGSETAETLFAQNYENETAITGWTSLGANISLGTGDATHGKFFHIAPSQTNTRYAYQRINQPLVRGVNQYTVEFDLALSAGNTDGGEFCVMAQNGKNPSNSWDNYAAINNKTNMLFDLTGSKRSTVYTVNGTSSTTTLNAGTWYHVTLSVNRNARTVAWSISNGSSGTFTMPSGSNTEFGGFYLVAGRYQSSVKLDNISVKTTPVHLATYTFREPGTLTVKSTLTGYAPSTTSLTVPNVYDKVYESADYSTITASNAAWALGSNWSTSTYTSRWANWNKNNTYTFANNNVNSSTQRMYVDDDQMLWVDFKGASYPLALVQGYGVGQNKAATFRAEGLGNEHTYVKLRYDISYGNHTATTAIRPALSDGTFAYTLSMNGTLQQCTIFMPAGTTYAPVRSSADEETATGIEETAEAETLKPQHVYSLSGVLIRSNTTSLEGLPRGIYIVGGKRVMVK